MKVFTAFKLLMWRTFTSRYLERSSRPLITYIFLPLGLDIKTWRLRVYFVNNYRDSVLYSGSSL